MANICYHKRVTDPAGVWDYSQLIGAKVQISSLSVGNLVSELRFKNNSFRCTISDIYFKVSVDGKAITIIRLKEFPESLFTWKDLRIISLPNTAISITNQALCGRVICGYGSDDLTNE